MTLRRAMIVVAALGLVLASYLTYIHYAGIKPACTAGQACEIVQTSVWSEVAGVPVALLGLIGYVFILGSLLVPDTEMSRLATLAITLMGFSFSAYLTYREIYSIHLICEECATSAGFLTILFVSSLIRFLRGESVPPTDPPDGNDSSPTDSSEIATLTANGQ